MLRTACRKASNSLRPKPFSFFSLLSLEEVVAVLSLILSLTDIINASKLIKKFNLVL